jgi:hypothetical protein
VKLFKNRRARLPKVYAPRVPKMINEQSPTGPLPYNKAILESIRNQIALTKDLSKLDLAAPEPYKTEYTQFVDKLMVWSDHTGKEIIPVLNGHFDNPIEYAKYLKKGVTGSFLKHHAHVGEQQNKDGIEGVTSYDDLFPFSHLPYIKPDTVEDWKYYFREVRELSDDFKNEFKSTLEKLLEDRVKTELYPFSSLEVLRKISAVSTYNEKDKILGVSRLKRPYVNPSTNRLIGKRVEVYVSPANERDSVKWEINSLESIQIIGSEIWQLLENFRESSMTSNRASAEIREDYLQSKGAKGSSWNRDFKKCGIAFNRELFILIKEVLCEKYPHMNYHLISAFEDIFIKFDFDNKEYGIKKDIPKFIPRGYGLGSASELVTLTQIVMFHMAKNRMNHHKNGWIDAMFWHDDALFVGDYDSIKEFKWIDMSICSEADLILKDEACGRLYGGTLYMEKYYSNRHYNTDKTIRSLLSLRGFQYCRNITAAKFGTRGMSFELDFENESILTELHNLIRFWGYEFVPEESFLPACFGGWIVPYDDIFDCSWKMLLECEDKPELHVLSKLMNAEGCGSGIPFSKRSTKTVENVPDRTGIVWLEGHHVERINTKMKKVDTSLLCWNTQDLKRKLCEAVTMRSTPQLHWDRLYNKRYDAYHKKVDASLLETDLFNRHTKEIYPKLARIPDQYIVREAVIREELGLFASISAPLGREQKWRHPLTSVLSYLKDIDDNKISVPEVEYVNTGMAMAYLEGHVLDVVFDKKYDMYKYSDLDPQFQNYSYLPILLSSEYTWTGKVPGELMTGISLPQIPYKPVVNKIELDLNRRYSGCWLEEAPLIFLSKFTSDLVGEDEIPNEENFYDAIKYAPVVDLVIPPEMRDVSRETIMRNFSTQKRYSEERDKDIQLERDAKQVQDWRESQSLIHLIGGIFNDSHHAIDALLTGRLHDYNGPIERMKSSFDKLLYDDDSSSDEEEVLSEEDADINFLAFGNPNDQYNSDEEEDGSDFDPDGDGDFVSTQRDNDEDSYDEEAELAAFLNQLEQVPEESALFSNFEVED